MKPYEKAGRIIRLLAWLQIVAGAVLVVLDALLFARWGVLRPEVGLHLFAIMAAILQWIVARAVMTHQAWGQPAGILVGFLYLLAIPIGTLAGVYVLWRLIRNWDDKGVVS